MSVPWPWDWIGRQIANSRTIRQHHAKSSERGALWGERGPFLEFPHLKVPGLKKKKLSKVSWHLGPHWSQKGPGWTWASWETDSLLLLLDHPLLLANTCCFSRILFSERPREYSRRFKYSSRESCPIYMHMFIQQTFSEDPLSARHWWVGNPAAGR